MAAHLLNVARPLDVLDIPAWNVLKDSGVPLKRCTSVSWKCRPRQTKKCLRTCAKCEDSDHLAYAQSIIRALALQPCILYYPVILLSDSEGPDQTAHPRSLIWAITVRTLPEGSSLGGAHMINLISTNLQYYCIFRCESIYIYFTPKV